MHLWPRARRECGAEVDKGVSIHARRHGIRFAVISTQQLLSHLVFALIVVRRLSRFILAELADRITLPGKEIKLGVGEV